jgi:hypothetical protein
MDALCAQDAPERSKSLHSAMSYKRLEAGRFIRDWRAMQTREMDYTGLKMLLEGIEPVRRYKRYQYRAAGASKDGVDTMSV